MLNLSKKSKLEISIEELFLKALQYNNKCLDVKNISDRYQTKIHNYNKELTEFSILIGKVKQGIEIHCHNAYIENDLEIFKYYFIDSTGLSHGYICGATALEEKESQEVKYLYGEPFLNKAYFLYDFIYSSTSIANLGFEAMPLQNVIKNHLPLPFPSDGKYFNTEIRENLNQHSSIICTKNNQSFCLPIVEIICNTLNLKWTDIKVKTTLEKDYIKFLATKSWRTKKYNNETTWTGKISYENLEIMEIENIGTEREYDW